MECERSRELMARRPVLNRTEARWLEAHQALCERCTGLEDESGEVIALIRGLPPLQPSARLIRRLERISSIPLPHPAGTGPGRRWAALLCLFDDPRRLILAAAVAGAVLSLFLPAPQQILERAAGTARQALDLRGSEAGKLVHEVGRTIEAKADALLSSGNHLFNQRLRNLSESLDLRERVGLDREITG